MPDLELARAQERSARDREVSGVPPNPYSRCQTAKPQVPDLPGTAFSNSNSRSRGALRLPAAAPGRHATPAGPSLEDAPHRAQCRVDAIASRCSHQEHIRVVADDIM